MDSMACYGWFPIFLGQFDMVSSKQEKWHCCAWGFNPKIISEHNKTMVLTYKD